MGKKQNKRPTEKEMEVLQVLWEKGSCTVREVYEELSSTSGVGYTTILKIMQIMNDKEMLSRVKEGKTHTYSARIKKEETQKFIMGGIIDKVFQGSALKLVMQALGDSRTSSKDLDEVKEYLKTLEKGKDNE